MSTFLGALLTRRRRSDDLALMKKYYTQIDSVIIERIRVILLVAVFLYLFFLLIDKLVYPSFFEICLRIRAIVVTLLLILLGLTRLPVFHSHVRWLCSAMALVAGLGIAAMIFLTDGSSSQYFDGIILVFLGLVLANPFYLGQNLFSILFLIGMTEMAMLFGPPPFDAAHFWYANAFLFSNALLVLIMTKLHNDQYWKGFEQEQQLSMLYSQADRMSKIDELTGVFNRRHFFEILHSKISLNEATGQSFYVVIFDVDHFKEINDQHGHVVGDRALQEVSRTVQGMIRSSDVFARYGGDEFLLIMDITNRDLIQTRLAAISKKIHGIAVKASSGKVHVSATFGATRFHPRKGMNEESLVTLADKELLAAKAAARGTIRVAE